MRLAAEADIAVFVENYGAKYPKAVECLTRGRDAQLAFFDLPAGHSDHLRTTAPIVLRQAQHQAVLAMVQHRTIRPNIPASLR